MTGAGKSGMKPRRIISDRAFARKSKAAGVGFMRWKFYAAPGVFVECVIVAIYTFEKTVPITDTFIFWL
jgi:hypothetical protein